MNLYDLNQTIQVILDGADENGEINADLFDQLQIEKDEKQENIIKYIKSLKGNKELIDQEIERLETLKKQLTKKSDWLVGYLSDSMKSDSTKELNYITCSAKFKLNPPSVILDENIDLPVEYVTTKTVTSPNKAAIKLALAGGIEIEGARLVQETRLSIN